MLGLSAALLLASAFAAESIPSVPPVNQTKTTTTTVVATAFANEKLWYWQKRLNLQDWRLSVAVVRATDLKPKTLGNVHWDIAKKTAVIRVLDPADYQLPTSEMLDDMEVTVVHELVHLELAPVLDTVPRDDASRRREEHAVVQMVDALLKLQRGR
jgi:hypothetical protein